MIKITTKFICILGFITLTFMGCNSFSNKENSNDNSEIIEKTLEQKIKDEVNEMSIDEKIGQLFIMGFVGTKPSDEIINLIQYNYIGGVILFSDNVSDVNGVINLTNSLKETNLTNKHPLFISVDEEGGRVSRAPEEINNLPTSGEIAKVNEENLCYEVGTVISKELSILGYNMDFAPVLDIFSNPNNTVIGDRAFGSDSDIVTTLGLKTMEGIRDGGIIPVVKHFPGHGDTDVDSHVGLPIVTKGIEELNDFEFIPFREAIKDDVDVVMVAHIILSAIDANEPSTMSKEVIDGILRKDLGYEGVVVTDDMTMGAILNNYDIGDATVKSINAGADLILVCHEYENQIKALNAVKDAVKNGVTSEERINESVERILKLKKKYNLTDNSITNNDNVESINNQINNIINKVNN